MYSPLNLSVTKHQGIDHQVRMYRCAACSVQSISYESVEELEIHIAADHINHIPYECERCRFSKFPTEFALISHCTVDHGLKEFYIKYKLTPDFHRKREKIRDMVHHSIMFSKIPFTPYKRRRMVESSLLSSSGEIYAALASEEIIRINDKEAKCESVKGSEVEPEDSAPEKEPDSQPNTFPEVTLQQDGEQVNIAGIIGDLYSSETNGSTSGTTAICEPTEIADITNGIAISVGEGTSQQTRRRVRPPRTCSICGLQVTGQRSSLIYHANSKHLRLPMFFCRECKKTWTTITKSDVIKHVKACHEGDESVIEDHRVQYAKNVHEVTEKCFPRKGRGNYTEDEIESFINPELWVKNEENGNFVGI